MKGKYDEPYDFIIQGNKVLLKEVPFKGNGKSAQFFDDRVEFNGNVVRYDDIETFTTNAQTTIHTYVGIPVGRSFDGGVLFKMNNGKTHRIAMRAMTVFGIPIMFKSPRKSEKLYPALYEALYEIVAKYMAQKMIYRIRNGETIEISGLIVNSAEARKAKIKAKEAEKVTVITKDNYRESLTLNISVVAVYDKAGDVLWKSSVWRNKNILLVPYILDAIFGK